MIVKSNWLFFLVDYNFVLKFMVSIGYLMTTPTRTDSFPTTLSKANNQNFEFNKLNITSILNKQIKLPCFIQTGRKFIWMHANRDEILSIDSNIITGDRRFSIEQTQECSNFDEPKLPTVVAKPTTNFTQTTSDLLLPNFDMSVANSGGGGGGCWVYLIINSVNLYDEGMYVCQIDTMTSTLVYLNILGKPYSPSIMREKEKHLLLLLNNF